MSPRLPPSEQSEDDADPLPDGTKTVINRNTPLTATVTDEWWDADAYEFDARPSRVKFAPGEEIPLPLARICWSAFHDGLEAEDGNGTVLSPAVTSSTAMSEIPGK